MKTFTARSSKALLPALGAALLFASCGDDKSSGQTIVQPDQQSHIVVAILEDAGLCDWNRYGQIALVTSEDREYVCDGEKWDFVYYEPDWSSEGGESSQSGEGGEDNSSSSSSSSADAPIELCGAVPYETATHFCDIRDSSVYEMVRIGSQTWMKENLNFDYKIDGVSYGSHCYNNEPDSCAKYGRLYTWGTAMDSVTTGCGELRTCDISGLAQGVCPNGWHLPDTAEWNALLAAVAENPDTAGTALKTVTGWYDGDEYYSPGTNSSGFSALPGGYAVYVGQYENEGNGTHFHAGDDAIFWASTENGTTRAWAVTLEYNDADARLSAQYHGKNTNHSVRCLKN